MTTDEHSTQGGELPALEAGYYLATHIQPCWPPFVVEIDHGWWLAGDGERMRTYDPRGDGYALTPLPLRVQLPATVAAHTDMYRFGYNQALKDCCEALAKAGIAAS